MPVYDFLCHSCGYLLENEVLTMEEYMAQKELGGLPCPECPELMRIKPGRISIQFGKVTDHRGQEFPGGKRERRQLMEKRYKKRNKRLEQLPPEQKEKMVKFMERRNVRRTAPADPDFV